MKKIIVVTGGAGFIGSNLIELLLNKTSFNIISLDNYSSGLKKNHIKSNRVKFSNFYNSVLSSKIADELNLDLNEPYIEIVLIPKNSTFIAKKAKMFEEERSVAEKAPVDGILINDLNKKKVKNNKTKNKKFSYSIKIADFYYKDSAKIMINRIKNEANLKKIKIIKLSETKYRVLLGPFNDIKSLKDSFEKMNFLDFENLEILKNV